MTGGVGSMLLGSGNNISIGGNHLMEKPSDMVVHHRNAAAGDDYANNTGNPAVSPGGSSNSGSVNRRSGSGHESPVSVSSGDDVRNHQPASKRQSSSSGPNKSSSSSSTSSSLDEEPKEFITKLREHDCILGRGGFTNNYVGNANFRKLVNQHKMRYLTCNKIEKPKVARDVVRLWKQLDPPGRFLTKNESSSKKGESPVWIECSDKKAQEKASQSLRERTPDVLPYLSKLQEHRQQMREQGVSLISQHYQDSINSGSDQFQSNVGPERIASLGNMRLTTTMMGSGGAMVTPQRHHPSLFSTMNMDQSMNNSMNSSMNGSMNGMHTMMQNMGPIDHLQTNMSAGGCGHHPAMPVTPMEIRSQMAAARRSSMATINHLPGGGGNMQGLHLHPNLDQHLSVPIGIMGGNGMTPFDLEQQRQQVLQEAYSPLERQGIVDPITNRMFMEQMMMRERELIQQQQATVRGHQMMHAMQNPPFVGSMGGGGTVTRDCDVMMPEHQSMMIAAAQKQQQLLHESMRETIIEKHRAEIMKQQQMEKEEEHKYHSRTQLNKSNIPSQSQRSQPFARPQNLGDDGFVNIEPLPIEDADEFVISIQPDGTKSMPKVSPKKNAKVTKANRSFKSSPASKPTKLASENVQKPENVPEPPADDPETPDWRERERRMLESFSPLPSSSYMDALDQIPQDSVLPLNDTVPAPPTGTPAKLKSAFKKSSKAAPRGSFQSTGSSDSNVNEYRRTLEDYMANHQSSSVAPGSINIDDDISDSEGDMGGVDASAWIQQALHSSGETSAKNNNKRKKKRQQDADALRDDTNHDSTGFASTHTRTTLDLMSTDGKSLDCGKSMDCKSLECMSFMSLAMSEMEKSMEQLRLVNQKPPSKGVATAPASDDDSDMLEYESINFGSPSGQLRKRSGASSNQSVMSELTDFSDNEDSDNEDGLGSEQDLVI
ncbi:hypothetical protein IV203_003544 [Nitzschia inconspicua]|uniref:DUF6824 domain-containing protein n=1 Tax=Nitzschia inconspicua TaxID=303405 RepID=A0A9K3L213_9STRA|nr:hypothetical protein IV203_003544 [Nitzschia inconspicua]